MWYTIHSERPNSQRRNILLKAKTVNFKRTHLSRLFRIVEYTDMHGWNTLAVPRHAKRKRQDSRIIKTTQSSEGELQTTHLGMLRTFRQFYQTKYVMINTDNENIARMMVHHKKTTVPPEANTLFDVTISAENCIRRSNKVNRTRLQGTMLYVTIFTS